MSAPPRRSATHRPALVLLVAVAALGALALGWWQWERFESASGTAQNLGYALQWPLFAGFAVFAYFRFVRMEAEVEVDTAPEPHADRPDSGGPVAAAGDSAPAAKPVRESKRPRQRAAKVNQPREIPAGILPDRPKTARDEDAELAQYNRYLAGLYAEDAATAATGSAPAGTPAAGTPAAGTPATGTASTGAAATNTAATNTAAMPAEAPNTERNSG